MSGAEPKRPLLVLTSTFPRWPNDHEPPFVYELCRRLTDRFDVTVLAPHAPGAKRREIMDRIQVERFRYAPDRLEKLAYTGGIPARLKRHPWLIMLVPLFVMAQLFVACRLIRGTQPTVVHAHWIVTGGLVARLLRPFARARFRLVLTAHGGDVYGLRHPLLARLKRWVLSDADAITAVSPALADELIALGALSQSITVQAMGTDLRRLFIPAEPRESGPQVIYAGRLVEKKGVDTLIKAFAKARLAVKGLQLQIAGHGPEQEALAKLVSDMGLDSQVHMIGPYRLTDLPGLYANASLAVFPFRVAADGDQDGLGLAIVEAMGCGVPVITTRLPVLAELAEHGVTAITVDTDDVDALATEIIAYFQDPTSAKRLALAARERVLARFDWQVVSARYATILEADLSPDDAHHSRADS